VSDISYQSDLKITKKDEGKVTLSLSYTGDLQLITGEDKLLAQLLRAVVNDETSERVMNAQIPTRLVTAYVNLILRFFRQTQIDYTKKVDANLSGFVFYKKASAEDDAYSQISNRPVQWKFQDTNLENGITCDYAASKIYNDVFETSYVDKISIAPSRVSQTIIIGNSVVAVSGDESVTFYVNFNKKFKQSELLDKIISIDPKIDDQEPRKYSVDIKVMNLLGNYSNISIGRLK